MALPVLDATFASAADLPRRQMLARWLVEELGGSGSIADYYDLPERYLWAKIAVAVGAPKSEADYISLPTRYVWKAIYDAVSGSSLGTIDWSEKQALGHIAAAYRGDTANPESLATYIDWPWRYQVASIVTYPRIDADALAYIQRVETADGASLESGVRLAIDNFVRGCKTDGIWDAIKASTILAGARTLSGALQPLVGAAPTNFNFVSGDYNRKTGLVGDGSTKYLNSNRAGNADPQDSHHLSIFATTASSGATLVEIGAVNGSEVSMIGRVSSEAFSILVSRRFSTLSPRIGVNISVVTGFRGVARPSSTLINARAGANNFTLSESSVATGANTTNVFRRGGDGMGLCNGRLAFYSIGESLNLALLDTRVTNLINAYTAAIP